MKCKRCGIETPEGELEHFGGKCCTCDEEDRLMWDEINREEAGE